MRKPVAAAASGGGGQAKCGHARLEVPRRISLIAERFTSERLAASRAVALAEHAAHHRGRDDKQSE